MDRLVDVATDAVRAGGDYLASEFRNGHVAGEYTDQDVKTAVDRESERRILAEIEATFPTHATHGEETGRNGDSPYVWIIDPLDGTNNFACGLPSFATAVCVRYEDETVVSAIYEPLPDSLYVARAGNGATVNGRPLSAESAVALEHGTISFVIGLPAVREDHKRANAQAIKQAIAPACKRVLETWSPCVDWGLLARGGIEAVVCYYPDVYEQYAGVLLAEEAGASIVTEDGLTVAATSKAHRDRLFELAAGSM